MSSIFLITLDPEKNSKSPNQKLIYLSNLRKDLEDEGIPTLLTHDRLDSAILEAASAVPMHKSVLDYLIPCFKRTTKALNGLRDKCDSKLAILKEAERLCICYCIFAIDEPDLFG